MKQQYPQIMELLYSPFLQSKKNNFKRHFYTVIAALLLVLPTMDLQAQITYTLGTGTTSSTTLGVTPFSTSNLNSRSQYLYLAEELLNEGAISGNIISLQVNVTSLGLPLTLKPENITIKMGMIVPVTLDTELIPDLPVYYSSSVENITATGWHTFTLSEPFEWDGLSNIVVEICRSNESFGTSYGVETTFYNPTDYRTVGLYSNSAAVPGCLLTGSTPMINSDRRTRPNMKMTMTNPCEGTPAAGTTAVSAGPYCDGAPFTLSVANGSIESGLAYQWQSAPTQSGPWTDIPNAINANYSTAQAIATWYRRGTTCLDSQQTINSFPLLVGGTGCYCTADVVTDSAIGVTNVTFNTINNSSASDVPYSNFTTMQTQVMLNQTLNLSARVNTNGGTNYTMAWIDWNQDGNYDVSEAYSLGTVTGGSNVNSGTVASVVVPSSALLGSTYMRVRTSQTPLNVAPQPCGGVADGESEDYRVMVVQGAGVADFSGSSSVLINTLPQGIKVSAKDANLSAVTIYDLSGRLLSTKSGINASSIVIDLQTKGQVLIIKIQTENGAVINKKIIL
jgi:hypothetical protein